MAVYNKTFQSLASKLGLGDEDKVIRKAAEFERLLQTKSIAGSNMTDTSKVVICLDLAASFFAVELDSKMAIRFSGLKPSMYMNSRKVVENLLEINSDRLTVPGLCVTLQCSGLQQLANNILEEYRKQAIMEIDLNLPQYVCMAVYQASRVNKVKLSKSKLLEKSRIKTAQWNKLEADWTKFVDENFTITKKKRGRPAKGLIVNDKTDDKEIEKCPKDDVSIEPKIEPYEDWKRRMLETAHKELRELEELQRMDRNKMQKIEKVDDDSPLSPTKGSKKIHLISPKKNSLQVLAKKNVRNKSPLKDNKNVSVTKESTELSPKKDTPKIRLVFKNNTEAMSPRKDTKLMSPKKDVLFMSPRKDTQQVSPKKDIKLMSQEIDTGYVASRKSASLLSSMQEDGSPRRSPRKTPRKYSPYKTPIKSNTIRLLFPNNI